MSAEVGRVSGDLESRMWTVDDVVAAFVEGTDEQRQAIANRHSDVVRENGPLFEVKRSQST